jgi:hypothetical protein
MIKVIKWIIWLVVAFCTGWGLGGLIGIVWMVREYERSER